MHLGAGNLGMSSVVAINLHVYRLDHHTYA